MKELQAWVDTHFKEIRKELFSFLRFKTISADPSMAQEQERCVQWLQQHLQKLDCKCEVIPTPGNPLVYAEDLRAGPKAPTLLIYGHYDVQPVDPIEQWNNDPFDPIEKNGNVYARGAQDDKGQIFYGIMALRAIRETHRPLPINLKFCIEGEEEVGSTGLSKMIPTLSKKLSADYLLVIDFDILDADTPSINLGARGIITMELLLRGSTIDLHSGLFGGIAYNPNRALAELIAGCWDANGRVQVPYFYDDVLELTAEEKRIFTEAFKEKFVSDVGIEAHASESGRSLQEANWTRPTFEVNGMAGGYAGPGFKTVIPAEARAKISCRLVPNQDPEKIGRQIVDFLRKKVKKGIQIEVVLGETAPAYRGRFDSKLASAVAKAYEQLFDKRCAKTVSGGSIPVIASLIEATQAEVVGMGYGLPSDNVHAPNEHFSLDRFKKGIVTVALVIGELCR